MNDLITITHANIGGAMMPTVDGRYIHGRLGIDTDFRHWIKRRIESEDLVENVDYTVVIFDRPEITNNLSPRIDYQLSLQAAMKIAIAEKTPKALELRDELVALLIKYATTPVPAPMDDDEMILRSMKVLTHRVTALRIENARLKEDKTALIEVNTTLAGDKAALIEDKRVQGEIIEVQAAKIAEDAPKVEMIDLMIERGDSVDCGQASTWLISKGFPCPGRNNLIKFLVGRGMACPVFEGYRASKEGVKTGYVGTDRLPLKVPKHGKTHSSKVMITAVKGMQWLQKIFPKEGPALAKPPFLLPAPPIKLETEPDQADSAGPPELPPTTTKH